MTLDRDAVHVWYTATDRLRASTALHDCLLLLPGIERERWHRLKTWRGRREYLLTRELVRTTLSQYARVDPRAWRFTANRYGRPEIAAPDCGLALRFNVTHTAGLIVCAVAWARDVGVDVEAWDRPRSVLALADRFFSPHEAAAIRGLSAVDQDSHFVRLWTLKEAYVKARGVGLATGLRDASFTIADDAAVRVGFSAAVDDDAGRWQFALLAPTVRHCIAVAVRTEPAAAPLAITLRKATIGATDEESDADPR